MHAPAATNRQVSKGCPDTETGKMVSEGPKKGSPDTEMGVLVSGEAKVV